MYQITHTQTHTKNSEYSQPATPRSHDLPRTAYMSEKENEHKSPWQAACKDVRQEVRVAALCCLREVKWE